MTPEGGKLQRGHRRIASAWIFPGVSEKTPPDFFPNRLPQFFPLPTRIQENAESFFLKHKPTGDRSGLDGTRFPAGF